MAVNINEQGEITLAIPVAILGLDMTKFQQSELELRSDETFDENLKRLFGISADQAAEIINYSEMSDMIITNEPSVVGGGRKQKGGVGVPHVFQAIGGVVFSAFAMMNNINTAVNYVTTAVAFVDRASMSFVERAELRETATLWRGKMSEHCPYVLDVPVTCGFADVDCKLFKADETGVAKASHTFHSTMCAMATEKYTAAASGIPEAERAALEAGGEGLQGIVNLVNVAALSRADLEELKKARAVDAAGRILSADGYAKYFESKDKAAAAAAAAAAEALSKSKKGKKAEAPEGVAAPSAAAAPEDPAITAAVAAAKKEADDRAAAEAAAPRGPRSSRGRRPSGEGGLRKTKKSNTKRRVTRRKVPARLKFVY